MHVKLPLFTFFIVLSLMLGSVSKLPADDGNGLECLELPVRFHLLSDITMEKAGVEMGMWVHCGRCDQPHRSGNESHLGTCRYSMGGREHLD